MTGVVVRRLGGSGEDEEGSSLSALVTRYLRSLSESKAEFARLEAQQKRIQAEIEGFSARHNVDRDVLHDRALR